MASIDGLEFEWTPGVGDGQGGLACCNSRGRKESDTTERLNWTELNGVQFVAQSCLTLCDPKNYSTPGFLVLHYLSDFTQIYVHWVSDAIKPSYPLLPPSPPALNLSHHRGLFQWVGSQHQVPKYWTFSFSISSSIAYLGLISFRIDWFDLLAVQGTLKVFSSTIVRKYQFFRAQPSLWSNSHTPNMTTGKTIVLNIWTFVSKVLSLLFNTLSRFVIAVLPRRKHLLISWLQSPSAVILESKKIKSVTVSIFSPLICYKVMGPDAMILVFWMLSFKTAFSLFFLTFITRLFSSYSLSAIRMVSSTYLRLLILLPVILISACNSASPAFCMIYSVYKLNKQGDNIQPWCTPFPIWNQSVVQCPVLTVASCPA